MTAPSMTRPPVTLPRPNLPKGLRWSSVWKVDGQFVEAEKPADGSPPVELPVNEAWQISGQLWVCPVPDCAQASWTFDLVDEAATPCCVKHPNRLVRSGVDATDPDPVRGARARVAAKAKAVYEARKQAALDATTRRADAARQAVADATRRTAADMRGHVPSLAAAGLTMAAGVPLILTDAPLAAAVGAGTCLFGAVAAYLVAYWVRRVRRLARRDEKQARKDRRVARHVASGVLATGVWLLLSSAATILPTPAHAVFTVLFGFLLAFAVNNTHWQELWATRHRLKEMARLRAEAEALRVAEEANRVQQEPASDRAAPDSDLDDPAAMGARMAAEWARIAASQAAGTAFPQMPKTWINAAETREITAPDEDGTLVRIGWEYAGHAQPGALVARQGLPSPVVSARDWLAAVLFDGRHDASTMSIVDRPNGQANRFVLMVTDKLPLGDAIPYKGRSGIRRGADGSLFGHAGRTLLGDDAERVLWIPGQAGGGGRYGVTGSGKSVVTQITLLNDLYAGIFDILWDGKNLMDFAEFIGVIPVGCTREHRDVMYRSIRAEMERRQQMLTLMEGRDRHGRPAPVEALWVPDRDGPPQRWTIEEFHLNARDQEFITSVTELTRLQRSSATMLEISTQGGGLADAGDSVLRDNLNQISMQIMRMGDHQARLTGYAGDYMPSRLPRLPGMMLMVEADSPAIPVRGAYVHRRDEDGNIYDHLFDKDNTPILTAPELPAATVEVYEREGLMDLWRMGQGPGGKQRLLSSHPVSPSGVALKNLGPFAGQVMPAADVLLAVVWEKPGCSRAVVDGHPAWLSAAAGGKVPAPSTISRAVTKLERDKKLTRTDGTYRVTDKAVKEAEALHEALNNNGARANERAANAEGETSE